MNAEFDIAAAEIGARMVTTTELSHSVSFAMPAVYPSGSPVTVYVRAESTGCFVSDEGGAAMEAELLGVTPRVFASQGRNVSEQSGVSFDNNCFFVIQVELSRLVGAIKMVAAASHKAAILTEARMSDQASRNDRQFLIERLVSVFGNQKVGSDVEFVGASSHVWTFPAQVELESDNVALFDATGGSHMAVYSAHSKFYDLKLVENGPKGVITVSESVKLKSDYRNLLQQTAPVIKTESESVIYEKAVAA